MLRSGEEVVNMQDPSRRYDWLKSQHPNRAWSRQQHLQSLDDHIDAIDKACRQVRAVLTELRRVNSSCAISAMPSQLQGSNFPFLK